MRIWAMASIFLAAATPIAVAQSPSGGDSSAETKALGWRGDGTGRFPAADPPVTWGRISETMKGLRTQAARPKGPGPGNAKPIPYGTVDEWLVLGPIPAEGTAKDLAEQELVPGEASLQPDAGDRAAGAVWKSVSVEGSLLHFNRLLPDAEDLKGKAVLAHAYVYSPAARIVLLRKKDWTSTIRINGEPIGKEIGRYTWQAKFRAGWNSILARSVASRTKGEYDSTPAGTCYLQVEMYGGEPEEKYEETGILWTVEPPQVGRPSCYQPLIVGNRIYVMSSPAFLICYDKITGKRLWMRDTGFWEFTTSEERAKFPDLFSKIDPKAKRFRELSEAYGGSPAERLELGALYQDLLALLQNVDAVKYAPPGKGQEPGLASQPISDGKRIYTLSYLGIVACHDLDGKRKWMTLENEGPQWKHGYMIAPMIVGKELLVEMKNIIGFDLETGKVQWKLPRRWQTYFHNGTREQGDQTDLVNYDGLGVYKPGLGFFPWSTTMREGQALYLSDCHNSLFMLFHLPSTLSEVPTIKGREYSPWTMPGGHILLPGVNWGTNQVLASPLIHDGLIYTVSTGGVLRVEEVSLKHHYARLLDFNPISWAYPYPHGSGVCASPTLAGRHIYLFGGNGTSMVIRPGRAYERIAKNRIERLLTGPIAGHKLYSADSLNDRYPECTVSSPICDGKRLYYRAERHLYCIGEAK